VVVARTPREEFAAGARALGVTLLEGSYRRERVLRSAGAQTANALVVTEDDDVGNVHAALVAHDLNPRLRLRLRMFNQELGNRVQLLFRDCQILDAALPAMQRLGVPVLARDSRLRDTLQTLQVTTARSIVVVTSSDIVNLETALSARALRPDLRVVLRLFDADLAARVERTFGFHSCRSPSALAAPAFAAAAVGEHVIASIPAGRRVLLVARLRVGNGSRAADETVAALEQAIQGRVLTVAAGGEQRWCPAGDTRLVPDEDLTVVVTRQGLAEALAYIEASESLGHKE
jgi:Trk K+ transport system NAD-binding subunit